MAMTFTLSDDKFNHNTTSILSGFEYVEKKSLGFFEFDDINDKYKIFDENGFEAVGKIRIEEYGFEPKRVKDGMLITEETYVISRIKPRRVLIFQDTEFCKEQNDNVFIIPIQSLYKPTLERYHNAHEIYKIQIDTYNKIKERSEEIYDKYYFPEFLEGTEKERVLLLSDAKFVHKTMLFKEVIESGLNNNEIKDIEIRLSKMLNIQDLHKCSECEYNYKNYMTEVNSKEIE